MCEVLSLLLPVWLVPFAMIYFTALRPRMIAAANPIAATSPYLTKMKSTNPNKIRNVKMAVAVLPPKVVFDFIKLVIILHLTIYGRNSDLFEKVSSKSIFWPLYSSSAREIVQNC
jgi:hypothetical protein